MCIYHTSHELAFLLSVQMRKQRQVKRQTCVRPASQCLVSGIPAPFQSLQKALLHHEERGGISVKVG